MTDIPEYIHDHDHRIVQAARLIVAAERRKIVAKLNNARRFRLWSVRYWEFKLNELDAATADIQAAELV